jgi:polysaccharide pyruvyl transferase CsaB
MTSRRWSEAGVSLDQPRWGGGAVRALRRIAAPFAGARPSLQTKVRGKAALQEPKALRVLILGGDADGNLGDRAILEGLCHAARQSFPDIAVHAMSSDPARCRERLGVTAIAPGPKGFLRLCTAALRSDLVICGGGGLFQDDDSLIKMPYWALRLLLVRLLSRRIVGFSLGIGPLKHPVSRFFARLAFATMAQVSARDPLAAATAEPLTRKAVALVPDPALLLPPGGRDEARRLLESHGVPLDGEGPVIGVAVRRWFPPKARLVPHRIASKFRVADEESIAQSELLLKLLGEALRRMQCDLGAHIVFLPTYNLSHEGDDKLCAKVAAHLIEGRSSIVRISDAALYKAVTGELDLMLGGRMHPTILAAAVDTPIVGLSYNPKFDGFFSMLGLDTSLLGVEAFVRERKADHLVRMMKQTIERGEGAAPAAERLAGTCHQALREALEDSAG